MHTSHAETTDSRVDALGSDWAGYYHCFARMQGGRFDGLRAAGVASNKRNRARAAHMALAAACLA